MINSDIIIDQTRRWIATIVIGLNLCPFAKKVYIQDRIRYVVTDAETSASLLEDLSRELTLLATAAATSIETTLLIHPLALLDFIDFNDFLAVADLRLEVLGFRGVFQIASFHPDYQFTGTTLDAVENYTNRSPYPMLHLLREESISIAINEYPDADTIPDRNIQTLRQLGAKKLLAIILEVTEYEKNQDTHEVD